MSRQKRCGVVCAEEPDWSCDRLAGHPGRHESVSGGDWWEDDEDNQVDEDDEDEDEDE